MALGDRHPDEKLALVFTASDELKENHETEPMT
jgi:hypothetical protein